jgi:hypothetical protein
MKTNETQMKVYAVIGGTDYEGEDFDSLRLFDCRSTAVAYHKELTEVDGYDYAVMEVKEVCMESALLGCNPNLNNADGITTPW